MSNYCIFINKWVKFFLVFYYKIFKKHVKHESVTDREFPVLDIYKCPFSEMAEPTSAKKVKK